MGAAMSGYLESPITDKEVQDGISKLGLSFGASSMQGWRSYNEDAYSCLPDMTEDVALFGVYDGHGGSEVALYVAKYLPLLLKTHYAFTSGDMEHALREAFLAVDKQIALDETADELQTLAGTKADDEDELDPDEKLKECADLHEEAAIPLADILAKYKKQMQECVEEELETAKFEGSGKGKKKVKEVEDADESEEKKDDKKEDKTEDKKETVEGAAATEEAKSKQTNGEVNGEKTEEEKTDDKTEEGAAAAAENGEAKSGTYKRPAFSLLTGEFKEMLAKNIAKCTSNGDEDEEDDEEYDEEDSEEESEEYTDEDEEDSEEDSEEDEDIPPCDEREGFGSGTTACVAVVKDNVITVANVGDSRCVVCSAGKAIDLSVDHKPEDETEKSRIEKAGGKISKDGRVNGGLNLSRALGDHQYKTNTEIAPEDQMISPLPDIKQHKITASDEFMIIACDGIWNVLSSQETVDFVKEHVKEAKAGVDCSKTWISDISNKLMDKCMAPDTSGDGTGCDNMTCIVVLLNQENSSKRKLDSEEENIEAKKTKTS